MKSASMIGFEEYWSECLSLAFNDKQRQITWRLKNLYYDAWEEGKTPEQVTEEEWG